MGEQSLPEGWTVAARIGVKPAEIRSVMFIENTGGELVRRLHNNKKRTWA